MSSTTLAISEDESFTVENISVYANEGNLPDSKTIALANGAKDALVSLMFRLETPNAKNQLNCISRVIPSPSELVKEYIFKSERMTSKSYSGTVDIVFDGRKVKSILSSCGVSYATTSSGDTLLIPVIFKNGSYILSDETVSNDWSKHLKSIPQTFGLMNFKMLRGDIFDAEKINPQHISESTYEDIADVLRHYKCNNAMIMEIKDLANGAVIKLSFIKNHRKYYNTLNYKRESKETQDHFIRRVISDLIKNVDSVWKRGFESKDETVFNSSVTVKTYTNKDWYKIKTILSKIDIIKQYKYKNIDSSNVELELEYIGSPSKLSDILLQNGISVFQEGDKILMSLIGNK